MKKMVFVLALFGVQIALLSVDENTQIVLGFAALSVLLLGALLWLLIEAFAPKDVSK